jgi:hypothetical protein
MAATTKLRLGSGLPDAGVYTKIADDRIVSRMNAITLRSPSVSVGALISILTDPAGERKSKYKPRWGAMKRQLHLTLGPTQLRQTLANQCCCSRGTPAGR